MLQQISDSEMEVMQIIWENGGNISFAPLMKIIESAGKTWKKNTVLTFLVRLIDKGYLSATKTGRAKEYFATVTENEYQEEQAKIFLDKVYSGNVKGLVSALLKQDSLTKEDFRELHDFWKKGEDAK
ncbi:MAG TPA: transcriptional regulator [Ruminococcaceae bacterium]|nr:transcriptional regulator [Oscillospiraceae bacterium]